MGTMSTLDRTGDHRITWSAGNREEVAEARRTFDDLKRNGYLAYRASGRRGERGEQIRKFDPDAETIILVRQLVGG